MDYTIKLEAFEGPMDLLLTLIEEKKLDVTQVSLAEVADDFLEYVKDHETSIEHLADFLSVAGRLILLKSKALLPILELTQDEEEQIDDLAWQLQEYKRIKEAAEMLASVVQNDSFLFSRKAFVGVREGFYPPEGVGPHELSGVFRGVVDSIPVIEQMDHAKMREIVSLEQKIIAIQDTVRARAVVTFSEIKRQSKDTAEIIVSFLAILELVKQQLVNASQRGLFDEIHVKSSQKETV
jgi:segregation and condensation protein A